MRLAIEHGLLWPFLDYHSLLAVERSSKAWCKSVTNGENATTVAAWHNAIPTLPWMSQPYITAQTHETQYTRCKSIKLVPLIMRPPIELGLAIQRQFARHIQILQNPDPYYERPFGDCTWCRRRNFASAVDWKRVNLCNNCHKEIMVKCGKDDLFAIRTDLDDSWKQWSPNQEDNFDYHGRAWLMADEQPMDAYDWPHRKYKWLESKQIITDVVKDEEQLDRLKYQLQRAAAESAKRQAARVTAAMAAKRKRATLRLVAVVCAVCVVLLVAYYC